MQLLTIARFAFQNPCHNIQPCKGSTLAYRKHLIINTEYNSCTVYCSMLTRSIFTKSQPFKELFRARQYNYVANDSTVYSFLKRTLKKVPNLLRGRSIDIFKHCAEQCEFVVAHRLRRSIQILNLYTKIWDETALKQLLFRMRQRLVKAFTKHMLFASAVLYNWDKERIPDEEMLRYQNELDLIQELKRKKYCNKSSGGKCSCFNCLDPGELEWEAFVNEENLTVWKKEETNHIGEGLYCYKLYAKYEDVSALDFLEAQVDLDYRLTWDDHAVKLFIIDSERDSQSDVIYWETKWPTLFSNRDYVFKRRYMVDRNQKLVVLVNKSTVHPTCPVNPNKQRVTEYWSYMVIRPKAELDGPGIEFSLTYFDNPGMSMPSSLSSWVTATGMPAFLQRLHTAAKELRKLRKVSPLITPPPANDRGARRSPPSYPPDDRDSEGGGGGRANDVESECECEDGEEGHPPPTPRPKGKSDCPKLPKLNFQKLTLF